MLRQLSKGPVRRFCNKCRLARRRKAYAKSCQDPKFKEVKRAREKERRRRPEIKKSEKDYQRQHRKNPIIAEAQREYSRKRRQTVIGKAEHRQNERKRRALKTSQIGAWPNKSASDIEYMETG